MRVKVRTATHLSTATREADIGRPPMTRDECRRSRRGRVEKAEPPAHARDSSRTGTPDEAARPGPRPRLIGPDLERSRGIRPGGLADRHDRRRGEFPPGNLAGASGG